MLSHVAYVDRFGNAITDIGAEMLTAKRGHSWRVFVRGVAGGAVRGFYQQVAKGRALAVFSSLGLVEIAVSGDSAAKILGLKVGDEVELRASRKGGNCLGPRFSGSTVACPRSSRRGKAAAAASPDATASGRQVAPSALNS